MSTLVLIRHAQASSDQLSEAGKRQAELLGEYWRACAIRFDEVYSGTLQRHTHTAELAGFDKFEPREEFNEYDAISILGALPDYAPPRDNRELQNMFERAMPLWMAGKLQTSETWPAFRERVTRGFRAIIDAPGASRRIAVFTSGGPIGIAVQTVLQAPEAMAIELNWRIRNCSLTEFLFTANRISLDTFNATPHLVEVTFR